MPIHEILPVFITICIGFLVGKKFGIDCRNLSRVGLYVLSPALTFNSLYTANLNADIGWRLVGSTLLLPFMLVAVLGLLYRLAGFNRETARTMLLAASFGNAANFGLPVCFFVFGAEGRALGVVFVVCQNLLIHTLGVYLAATSELTWRKAVGRALRMPTMLTALLAIALRTLNVEIPLFLARTAELLAQATSPILLLILGTLLSVPQTHPRGNGALLATVSSRLLLSPALAGAIGRLFGLSGLPWKILVLQAAMPTPPVAAILAEEFRTSPSTVSRSIFWGTVASMGSLPAWLMILRSL